MCTGKVLVASDASEAALRLVTTDHDILLIKTLDRSFEALLTKVRGVIVEEFVMLSPEELQTANPDLVVISGVPDACSTFEDGLTVTLDGEEKLIYEGLVEEKLPV